MAISPLDAQVRVLESCFVGRPDVYALQQDDGRYLVFRQELTRDILSRHCSGELTVASFPLLKDGSVILGALDIDTKGEETRKLIQSIHKKAQELNLPCFVEPSGRKGYHVWFLFKTKINAGMVRHFLMRILETCHSSGKVPPSIEIFPKQSGKVELGNSLKLPFGVHRRTNKRTLIVNISDFTAINDLGVSALESSPSVSEADLKKAIGSLGESRTVDKEKSSTKAKSRVKVQLPCTIRMEAGAEEGSRDETMFSLGLRYRDMERTPQQAWEYLKIANSHNKPPLPEKELRTKLKQAYKDYPKESRYGFRCNVPAVAQYCDPNCPIYNKRSQAGYGEPLEDWQDGLPELDVTDIPHTIRVIPTNPPYYEVGVRDFWIVVDADAILSLKVFRRMVLRDWPTNLLRIPWKQPQWDQHMHKLLREAESEKVPNTTSEYVEITEYLYDWIRSTPAASTYEEILEGRPLLMDSKWHFRGQDATLQLKNRYRVIIGANKLWAVYVRMLGGNSRTVTTGDGQRIDLWWVPKDRQINLPPEEDSEFWTSKTPPVAVEDDFWGG